MKWARDVGAPGPVAGTGGTDMDKNTDPLEAGTRVRFNDHASWGEREGAEGVVVEAPNGPDTYPEPVPDGYVCVLLDDDPLTHDENPSPYGMTRERQHKRGWTCVTGVESVDVLGGGR